jgi:hypothetical protein
MYIWEIEVPSRRRPRKTSKPNFPKSREKDCTGKSA